MVPVPVAVALSVCEKVIVEEGTKNVSLISTFSRLRVTEFPARPQPFCVFATLLDGEGDATVSLEIAPRKPGRISTRWRSRSRSRTG
jgi:hypothetical protein